MKIKLCENIIRLYLRIIIYDEAPGRKITELELSAGTNDSSRRSFISVAGIIESPSFVIFCDASRVSLLGEL